MKYFSYIILALIIAKTSMACDCESSDKPFVNVSKQKEFVALIKVTKYLTYKDIYGKKTPMSMEVELIETYKGKETRKTFVVWGDNGFLCRPYLSQFKVGEQYVIAFGKGREKSFGEGHQNEKYSDYSISNCGTYWLSVDKAKQKVVGNVTDKEKSITLQELKKRLK